MISEYDAAGSDWQGQIHIGQILMQRATMKRFIITDHADRFLDAMAYLGDMYGRGKLRYEETIIQGFEQAPGALRRLFTGEKTGKLLVTSPTRRRG